MKIVDTYNVTIGFLVTILTAVFGVYWYIFAAYMILNVMDWLTGWYKSMRLKKESSAVGIKGIIKKLGYWVIIAVAFLMSNIFVSLGNDVLHIDIQFLIGIGWFTLACLLVNEARSIIENLVECGYNVPEILIKGLAITQKLLNEKSKGEDFDENEIHKSTQK